jgi:competence protein ComEC
MLPGGFDFARSAWFCEISATGSVLGTCTMLAPSGRGTLHRVQRDLLQHVQASLGGLPGTIAAAFASGDRGAIAETYEGAMRNTGLTHLFWISGLHVSGWWLRPIFWPCGC